MENARAIQARTKFGDGMSVSTGSTGTTSNTKSDPTEYLPYPSGMYRVRFPYDRNRRAMMGIWRDSQDYQIWRPVKGQTWAIVYDSVKVDSPKVDSPTAFRKVMDCLEKGLPVTQKNMDNQHKGIGGRFAKSTGRIGGTYAEIFTDVQDWVQKHVAANVSEKE